MNKKPLANILYAEDESDIREIAKIALEDIGGFHVIYCENGAEVLEKAEQATADLLLLDVMMPGMDGPETLKELRKHINFEKTPVIFMTAKIQPDEIAAYKTLGAIDVITKPFDPITLADTIKEAWDKYHE